jgi:hypothetical protein
MLTVFSFSDLKENGQESGPAPNYEQDTDSGSIVIRPRGEKIKKVSEFAKIEENFSHNLEGRGP